MNLNQALTPHFTLEEFVRSGVAIRHNIANTPSTHVVNNLRLLCEHVLEPLRHRFGVIRITSGYRCEELNNLVGANPIRNTYWDKRPTYTSLIKRWP